MANEEIDFTPLPRSIESERNRNLTWKDAMGELVDNSLDAGATRVEILFDRKKIEVSDDGRGCSDITGMLTRGLHASHPTTRLGRYGVGLKDTATWLWGCLRIDSVHKGKRYLAQVDWARLSKQAKWTAPPPHEKEAAGTPSGMRLTFTETTRKQPPLPQLAVELGKVFMPAIRSGRQIVIRAAAKDTPIVCEPFTLPPLENVVEDEFDVAGRSVRLRVGVVQLAHQNPLRGFVFIHGHRVIQESALGANGMSVGRVCGIIELGRGWTLSRNKNSIVDDDEQDQLAAEIFSRIQSVLEAGSQQATQLIGDHFRQQLNAEFRSALKRLASTREKEKRSSGAGGQPGTVEPKATGRKRRRATKTQLGDSIAANAERLAGSGRIEWKALDGVMGEVDVPGSVIWLNENHCKLQEYRAQENTQAVLNTAVALFAGEVLDGENRDRFPDMREMTRFAQVFAHIAAATSDATSTEQEVA